MPRCSIPRARTTLHPPPLRSGDLGGLAAARLPGHEDHRVLLQEADDLLLRLRGGEGGAAMPPAVGKLSPDGLVSV